MGVGLRARGGVMDLARACTQVEGILLDRRHMLLQVVFTMCPEDICHIKVIQSDQGDYVYHDHVGAKVDICNNMPQKCFPTVPSRDDRHLRCSVPCRSSVC